MTTDTPETRRHPLCGASWKLLLLACWIGCRTSSDQPAADSSRQAPRPPLRVLVIDDPEMARVIDREWSAVGADPLAMREAPADEFLDQEQRRVSSDFVIFPSPLLGALASRDWLQPLSDSDSSDASFRRRDIWELIRLHEPNWGGRTVAVPLGSPTFVLCFRQDVFARLGVSPPTTWSEYRDLAEQCSDRKLLGETLAAESPWFGTCEPLGPGWAAELLLARAAPYARHRSQFSTLFDFSNLRPLIDGPPFVRALEELASVTGLVPPGAELLDPVAAWRSLRQGHCAMAITWPQRIESLAGATDPPLLDLGFAPLPGSRDVYNFRTEKWDQRSADESPRVPLVGFSGRMGAITKECRDPSAAMSLLRFLSSPETNVRVSSASRHTALFRESQLAQASAWGDPSIGPEGARQYAETVQAILSESTCLTSLRIPARRRYMTVLDEAVRGAVSGKITPQESLASVAKQWDAITDEVGRDAQRRAYLMSIGLEE